MAKKSWQFEVGEASHLLELEHGTITGRRKLTLDGEVIEQSSKFWHLVFDVGSNHSFQIGASEGLIIIRTDGLTYTYSFFLDGEEIAPIEDTSASKLRSMGTVLLLVMVVVLLAFFFCYVVPVLIFVEDESAKSLREMSITFVSTMSAAAAGVLAIAAIYAMLRSRRLISWLRWILLAMSVWLYIEGMIIWGVYDQGHLGILAAVIRGAPKWLIIFPILSALSILVLAFDPPGGSILLPPVGIAITSLAILFFEYEDVSNLPGFSLAFGGKTAFLFGAFYVLISTAYAMRIQSVPLDAWFAKLHYLGTYHHYLSLYEFARVHKFELAGPVPETKNEVFLRGRWISREVEIHSGKGGLSISMISHGYYWPCLLRNKLLKLPSNATSNAVQGSCLNARGKEIAFYIWPLRIDFPIQDVTDKLQDAISAARPFLRGGVEIGTTGPMIYYARSKFHRMPLKKSDIEGILDWMTVFLGRLEELGLWEEMPEEEVGAGEEAD
jgi:hypothetical protein